LLVFDLSAAAASEDDLAEALRIPIFLIARLY
jgi:hypothetical protein